MPFLHIFKNFWDNLVWFADGVGVLAAIGGVLAFVRQQARALKQQARAISQLNENIAAISAKFATRQGGPLTSASVYEHQPDGTVKFSVRKGAGLNLEGFATGDAQQRAVYAAYHAAIEKIRADEEIRVANSKPLGFGDRVVILDPVIVDFMIDDLLRERKSGKGDITLKDIEAARKDAEDIYAAVMTERNIGPIRDFTQSLSEAALSQIAGRLDESVAMAGFLVIERNERGEAAITAQEVRFMPVPKAYFTLAGRFPGEAAASPVSLPSRDDLAGPDYLTGKSEASRDSSRHSIDLLLIHNLRAAGQDSTLGRILVKLTKPSPLSPNRGRLNAIQAMIEGGIDVQKDRTASLEREVAGLKTEVDSLRKALQTATTGGASKASMIPRPVRHGRSGAKPGRRLL